MATKKTVKKATKKRTSKARKTQSASAVVGTDSTPKAKRPAKKRSAKRKPAKKRTTSKGTVKKAAAKRRARKTAKASTSSRPSKAPEPVVKDEAPEPTQATSPDPASATEPSPVVPPPSDSASPVEPTRVASYLDSVPQDGVELLAGLFQVARGAAKDLRTLLVQAMAISHHRGDRHDR